MEEGNRVMWLVLHRGRSLRRSNRDSASGRLRRLRVLKLNVGWRRFNAQIQAVHFEQAIRASTLGGEWKSGGRHTSSVRSDGRGHSRHPGCASLTSNDWPREWRRPSKTEST